MKNGGIPPLTFKKFHVLIRFLCDLLPGAFQKYRLIFQKITEEIGHPPKPVSNVDWLSVNFGELPISILEEFTVFKIRIIYNTAKCCILIIRFLSTIVVCDDCFTINTFHVKRDRN